MSHAGLLLDSLRQEALSFVNGPPDLCHANRDEQSLSSGYFANYIQRGAELSLLDYELTKYDLHAPGPGT